MRKLLLASAALLFAGRLASACDEMGELRRAMQAANAVTAGVRRDEAEKALADAEVVMDVLNDYLELLYFPGLFALRTDVIELTVPKGKAYQLLAADLQFLRGQPGAVIKLKPSDRNAQFDALKARYLDSLQKAATAIQKLGGDAGLSNKLWGLLQWGVESQVRADGTDESSQIITHEQRRAMFAPNPPPAPPFKDPHE